MKRVEWNRFSGEKLPDNAKLVSRPSKWGNPYSLKDYSRDESIALYRQYITRQLESGQLDLSELRGKDLVCTGCKLGDRCHADVLLELAKA